MSVLPNDGSTRRRRVLPCFLLLLLLASAMLAQSAAVEAPITGAAGLSDDPGELFEALPTRSGLLLRPRADDADVRAIEIIGDQVAIDGEDVRRDDLEERLGGLAGPVIRLLEQSPRERRVALGLEDPAPAIAATEPAAADGADGESDRAADDAERIRDDESDVDAARRTSRVDLGQRVSLGSGVKVGADETAEQAIAIGGGVSVDGEVEQDVLAVGGSASIDGRVGGEVVAVGGSVLLGPEADVEGNVTSVGGRVRRESGSQVGGVVSEVSMARFFGSGGFSAGLEEERRHTSSYRSRRFGDFFGQILWAFFVAILVWICGIVAGRPLGRVEHKLRTEPGQSALAGFLAEILIVPLVVVAALILVISVIGIPLLVLLPVVGFLFAIGMLFGYAASARWLADRLAERFGWNLGSGFKASFVGVAALHIWMILGAFLSFLGGPAEFFAAILFLFGAVVQFIAVTAGLGAVILTRFGAGPRGGAALNAPPSPPPAVPPPFEPLSPITPTAAEPAVTAPAAAVEPGAEPGVAEDTAPPEPVAPARDDGGGDGGGEPAAEEEPPSATADSGSGAADAVEGEPRDGSQGDDDSGDDDAGGDPRRSE